MTDMSSLQSTDAWKAVRERASGMLAMLTALQGETSSSQNPHRIALSQLNCDGYGWSETCYNDAAFETWNKLLARSPDDIETIHHLAIMHHARAMDLERDKPTQSDRDWQEATAHWHKLWQDDGFWEGIASNACRNMSPERTAAIKQDLRDKLPIRLVQIHYDIAYDPATKYNRAKYHIQAAKNSPFAPEIVKEVSRATYDRMVSVVPANVWYANELNPATIKQGTDVIEAYLKIDPTCTYALMDALRLQVRLLRSMFSELQALGDSDRDRRNMLLGTLKSAADHWLPYMDQLISQCSEIPDEDREEASQKLGMWYRVMGDARCGLDLEEEAIKFYEQGIAGTLPDEDEHRLCIAKLGETYAYVAREHAGNKKSNAKSYADNVRQRSDLSVRAHRYLANAYSLLKEYDLAERVCRDGLSLPPTESTDWDDIEADEQERARLAEYLETIRSQRLLSKALDQISADQEADALVTLNTALEVDKTNNTLFFYRCHCYLTLGDIDRAEADLRQFKASIGNDRDAIEAAAGLENRLKEIAPVIRKFGPSGMAERQKAIRAHNNNDYAQAEAILRNLLKTVPTAGAKDVKSELSIVLTQKAIALVNSISSPQSYSSLKMVTLRQAVGILTEAIELDRSNKNAVETLAMINQAM